MEWFQVRDSWLRKSLQSISLPFGLPQRSSAVEEPPWPLPGHLRKVREFLLREAYVLAIEEKRVLRQKDGFYYVALVINPNREPTTGLFVKHPIFAHATDVSYELAFSRAVGEFVERYAFLIYQERSLLRRSIGDLRVSGETFLDPLAIERRLVLGPLEEETDFLWIFGKNLCTSKPTLLPAQLVFWNYDIEHDNWEEPLLRERNSCGLASGFNLQVAIRNALYELIQRDAFFVHWFSKTAPIRIEIDINIDSERFQSLYRWCRDHSIECYFMEVTADIPIPSFLCVLRSCEGNFPVLSLGLGTGFGIVESIESALVEAIGLYRWTLSAQETGMSAQNFEETSMAPGWQALFTAKDRALMWSRPDMYPHLSFLMAGPRKKLSEMIRSPLIFNDLDSEIQSLLVSLSALGSTYEPIVYVASDSLSQRLSSSAVRVLVPALVPMYMEETGAVSPRQRIVAFKKTSLPPDYSPYPYPHPFP